MKNYSGMTLWPFLLIAVKQDVTDKVFINHENIHAVQQRELFIVFFYLWYGIEYLRHRCVKPHDQAYRSIVFEKEAYAMQQQLNYLEKRNLFAFINFYKTRS
jgi:hypothetical protein